MKDRLIRYLVPAVAGAMSLACTIPPFTPEASPTPVFTLVNEDPPYETPAIDRTPIPQSLGIIIPRGFDALIPLPETDNLYPFFFNKTALEGQRVTLLDYQNKEIVSKVTDSRGIEPLTVPDFGMYGLRLPEKKFEGENISYSRKILIWQDGEPEEWGVMQNLPKTSNQAENPPSGRSFFPLAKGGFKFVQDIYVPNQQPLRFDWVVL